MQGFKNVDEQLECLNNIRRKGMTVTGWARMHRFSRHTVVNLLCRESGRADNLGAVGMLIMTQLKKDGLV